MDSNDECVQVREIEGSENQGAGDRGFAAGKEGFGQIQKMYGRIETEATKNLVYFQSE